MHSFFFPLVYFEFYTFKQENQTLLDNNTEILKSGSFQYYVRARPFPFYPIIIE